MSVKIKNADEIEKMRVAGRLAAEVLHMIRPHVNAGITTEEHTSELQSRGLISYAVFCLKKKNKTKKKKKKKT